MIRRFIIADPEKCTGCGLCELVCAASKEKKFNPRLSRINAVRIEPSFFTAMTCRLCENPICVKCCPRHALKRDEKTGVILVDETRCDGCWWCTQVCEFGAIKLHPSKKTVVMCDLCGGEPLCVKACYPKALELTSLDAYSEKIRKSVVSKIIESVKTQTVT
ncbi:MAG: 4Fe-4S dicluster domain-containing protein [Candidatus Bathyarchaeia archaeon]